MNGRLIYKYLAFTYLYHIKWSARSIESFTASNTIYLKILPFAIADCKIYCDYIQMGVVLSKFLVENMQTTTNFFDIREQELFEIPHLVPKVFKYSNIVLFIIFLINSGLGETKLTTSSSNFIYLLSKMQSYRYKFVATTSSYMLFQGV